LNTSQRLSLTTNELVAVLALCGFERAASQILNDQDLIQNEDQFDRFVEQSEQLLKERGYWDDSRETKLASGLESMIRLLVNCSKKVRCMNGNNVMIIHLLNDKYSLSQHVTDQFHTFTFFQHSEGYQNIMNDLLGRKESIDDDLDKFQTIELSTDVFDEFHHLEQSVLHSMINDSELNVSMRAFLKDFLMNEQKLDNISFLKTNYVKDQTTAEQIVFLLPSNGFVWHIDYEQVQQDKLFIVPIPESLYVTKIEETIESFFQLKPTASFQ
jgi:hypothetical protein